MPLSAGSVCLSWPHGFFDPNPPHTPITFCWVMTAAPAATVALPQSTCSYLPTASFKITALSWSFDVLRLLAPHCRGSCEKFSPRHSSSIPRHAHHSGHIPAAPHPPSSASQPHFLQCHPPSPETEASRPPPDTAAFSWFSRCPVVQISLSLLLCHLCCPPFSAHPQNVSVPLGWVLVCPYSICTFFLGDCPPSHNLTCDIHTDGLKCVSEAQASLSVLDSYFRLSV